MWRGRQRLGPSVPSFVIAQVQLAEIAQARIAGQARAPAGPMPQSLSLRYVKVSITGAVASSWAPGIAGGIGSQVQLTQRGSSADASAGHHREPI